MRTKSDLQLRIESASAQSAREIKITTYNLETGHVQRQYNKLDLSIKFIIDDIGFQSITEVMTVYNIGRQAAYHRFWSSSKRFANWIKIPKQ